MQDRVHCHHPITITITIPQLPFACISTRNDSNVQMPRFKLLKVLKVLKVLEVLEVRQNHTDQRYAGKEGEGRK